MARYSIRAYNECMDVQLHTRRLSVSFHFRLNDIIWVLSGAIDYVGVTDIHHGKRVAFLAREINRHLCLDWKDDDLIIACLLHDCGVSSTDVHENLVHEMQWAHAFEHGVRGGQMLAAQDLFRHLASVIIHHHTPWSELLESSLPLRTRELANLIFLADRLDVLIATEPAEILNAHQDILKRLHAWSGTLFSPGHLAALDKAAQTESFWMVRSGEGLDFRFKAWREGQRIQSYEYDELVPLFSLFSGCVDGKSPYTADHSWGVRNLGMYLGALSGLRGEAVRNLGIAGLLHDLGKLRVPDAILEKRGPLDEAEFSTMKHHSYDTLDILCRIPGFDEIATWAASHHEKIDGSGYPFRLSGDQIPIESRIITVADIFQALVQPRPYRKADLQAPEIRQILQDLAATGKIDESLTRMALFHFDDCRSCALMGPERTQVP